MKKIFRGHAKKGGVYKITNKNNGKVYIGSTKNFKKRAYQHVSSLKNNRHQNKHLQASFNKHGADAFLFKVIEVVVGDKGERFLVEQQYIDQLIEEDLWKNTFNFKKKTVQKERTCFSKNPEETRNKLGKLSRERWKDPEYKKKTSKAISKSLQTPKNKILRSTVMKEMWENPVHKKHLAKVMRKHHKQQVETLDKYRKIANENSKKKIVKYYGKVLDPLGNVYEIYNMQNFAKKHNLDRGNLQKVIEEKHASCKGWRKYSKRLEGIPYKSNNNHKQKSYSLLSPNGIVYQGINITKFCATHNLCKENVTAVVNGRRKSHKGWKKLALV